MNVKHADPEVRSLTRSGAHRVWNIVELQVQKNAFSTRHEVSRQHRAFRAEQFKAHLEHAHMAAYLLGHARGCIGAGEIQGYNEARSRRWCEIDALRSVHP